MDQREINEILEKHKKWLNNEIGGVEVDLRGADLYGADLYEADLRGANLRGANLLLPIACPEIGSFIGYKKAVGGAIVTLQICEDAKRSSATTRKCRCSKAKVMAIEYEPGLAGYIATSCYDPSFIYEVGKTVSVNNFDDDRWNECAPGIHFFLSKEEARRY